VNSTRARRWHLVTAAVAIIAIVLQLVLVIKGEPILEDTEIPALGIRMGRFFSYFTIQSNLLVAVATVILARNPVHDGAGWRVLRLAGVSGIILTGLVHWFLIRPHLDLEGWDYAADKLLHVAVPLLAVAGWLLFGPRPRVSGHAIAWALAWPVAWLVWTLVIGGRTGWYPYEFLDVDLKGWGSVAVAAAGITLLFLATLAAAHWVDGKLVPAPVDTQAS
jgi:hypothetical protein